MKNHGVHRSLPIWLAVVVLTASSLACLTEIAAIDSAAFPTDYAEMLDWDYQNKHYEQLPKEYFERRQREEAEARQQAQEFYSTPQGEFAAPATSTAPQGQPAVPAIEVPVAASARGAPVILRIDFPATIPSDGSMNYGWVSFTDADGDVSQLRLHVVHSTTPMSDWEGQPGTLEGSTSAGRYRIGFYCTIPSLHTMQVTLVDAAGNASNPMDFSWECD